MMNERTRCDKVPGTDIEQNAPPRRLFLVDHETKGSVNALCSPIRNAGDRRRRVAQLHDAYVVAKPEVVRLRNRNQWE
jgi:hypothetical protein